MLLSLHVENLAVIHRLDLDFCSRFNVLSGETGSGKSVLLSAIQLLLGEKADKTLIRTGEAQAQVSGLFGNFTETQLAYLRAHDASPDEEGKFLLTRIITADGKNTLKWNGRSISVAVLRTVAPVLLLFHEQNDNISLLGAAQQTAALDNYADLQAEVEQYRAVYAAWQSAAKDLDDLVQQEGQRLRIMEMLQFQLNDIEALKLRSSEKEKLEERRLILRNMERISKQTGLVFRALKGSEKGSAAYLLDRSAAALQSIADAIPEAEELASALRDCFYRIDDVAERVYALGDEANEDPSATLDKVESRLEAIARLERKYGGSVDAVLAYAAQAKEQLSNLEHADERRAQLEDAVNKLRKDAADAAKRITEKRQAGAKQLESAMQEALLFMDMPKVRFRVQVEPVYEKGQLVLRSTGCDDITFLLSANAGDALQPMAKIASGGELSRIMLALRSILADKDDVSTLVFDEVDTGVSGKTARKIGIRMLSLASHAQILCVTHSAQVASLADQHVLLQKNEVDGRTVTTARILDDDGRLEELSRILGGIHVTAAQRAAARDMLEEKKTYTLNS